jgi:hypothetical protein
MKTDVIFIFDEGNRLALVVGLTPAGLAWRQKIIVKEPEEGGEGCRIDANDVGTLIGLARDAGLNNAVGSTHFTFSFGNKKS